MKRSNVTLTDLMEMLRIQDCPSIADVAYAYLETNGDFSVILKPEKKRSDPGRSSHSCRTGSDALYRHFGRQNI